MKEFFFTITDEMGLHARPAGLLVKKAAGYSSEITFSVDGRTASAKRLFAIMSLCAKKGEVLHVRINGSDEELAALELAVCLEENC